MDETVMVTSGVNFLHIYSSFLSRVNTLRGSNKNTVDPLLPFLPTPDSDSSETKDREFVGVL